MQARLSLCLLIVLALLAACRGGAPSEARPAARAGPLQPDPRALRLAGHWVACWTAGQGVSEQEDLRLAPAGGMRLTLSRLLVHYPRSENCSGGASTLEQLEESDLTLSGETVRIQDHVLEKFSRTGQVTDYVARPGHLGPPVAFPYPAAPRGALGLAEGPAAALRIADELSPDDAGSLRALTPRVYVRRR